MRLAALALALLLPLAARAQDSVATLPQLTDPRITAGPSHYSWLPQGPVRQQLLLFLPGTGGDPQAEMPFARLASRLGYHVISLSYPDRIAAQVACGNSPDPEAHMRFRLAIIQGGQFPRHTISHADSIQHRVRALLQFLARQQRGAGWDAYLNGNTVRWDRVAVSGSSQGGGHAYVISKVHEVARVIMFSSPKDYSFHFRRPPRGFDANNRTPAGRYFAFNHLGDDAHGCTHRQHVETLQQMQLLGQGVATVEVARSPYGHAHLLYTGAPVPPGKEHGSVIKFEQFAPVWTYLLTEPVR